jgi:hypothetical protein
LRPRGNRGDASDEITARVHLTLAVKRPSDKDGRPERTNRSEGSLLISYAEPLYSHAIIDISLPRMTSRGLRCMSCAGVPWGCRASSGRIRGSHERAGGTTALSMLGKDDHPNRMVIPSDPPWAERDLSGAPAVDKGVHRERGAQFALRTLLRGISLEKINPPRLPRWPDALISKTMAAVFRFEGSRNQAF